MNQYKDATAQARLDIFQMRASEIWSNYALKGPGAYVVPVNMNINFWQQA